MTDPELARERAHLSESRATLRRMRERATSLRAVGGDRVSTEALQEALWRRMRALEDDPDVPLFFGRLDYARSAGASHDERLYVGRRHVVGEAGGEPLVIDWRAGMALPFYRARPGEPMGVRTRRRFGFSDGVLTAYEDEPLAHAASERTPERPPSERSETRSTILDAEVERPRTGPMRDIVATIQPEQDVLVRADLARSLCIQGAPGTGKTAVGLHRAAFLLYAHRAQLARSGVLVVGPNDAFLGYIGDVLPALGEIDARSRTVVSLLEEATGLEARGADEPGVAVLKGDPRLAEVVRRAVWSHLAPATETVVVPRGSRQWRVAAYAVDEVVEAIRARGVRYAAGRDMVAQRIAHEVLLRMEAAGDSPDDRVQAAVARTRPVRAAVDRVWPALDPAKLVLRLWTDAAFLAAAADGVLTPDEQARLLRPGAPRSVRAARWSPADLALVDEAADVLTRTGSVGHLILDEAQDLSAMQLRAVGRRASTGSMTVLGDLAQATTPWSLGSWAESLGHLGKPDADVEELVAGFRVPGAVIDVAARLLPTIAPGLRPPHSVRRTRGELAFVPGDPLAAVAAYAGARPATEGTVGVIVADADVAAARRALEAADVAHELVGGDDDFSSHVQLVPASLAKGLEFDHVVLVEPAAIVAGEADRVTGLRRLYVCLTRAVTSLVVLHGTPLPTELG